MATNRIPLHSGPRRGRLGRLAWTLAIGGSLATGQWAVTDDLEQGFADPPNAARPRVYWWWLNSRVDREGITRDLEEYRAKGIGGVLLFDAGMPAGPMPAGPRFMSPEWRDLFKHTLREAERLGIEVSVNLCSGWDAGGPWITPEHAAHQFVQSELTIRGPRTAPVDLPPPPTNSTWYRDVTVQAFRERPDDRRPPEPRVKASSAQPPYPAAHAGDGSDQTFWVSNGWNAGDAPTPEKPEWLEFEFPEPFTVRRLHLAPHPPYGPREIEVQASEDGGGRFARLKTFAIPNEGYVELELPETTARVFRIVVTASYAEQNTQISDVSWNERRLGGRRALLWLKSGRDSSSKWSPTGSVRALVEAPLAPFEAAADEMSIDPASVIDLTAKLMADGRVEWAVPEGVWTILRTGYTTTGARVSCASPGGEGLEMDWLNATAMDHHFASMAAVLIEDAGPLAGKVLKYLHDDSWEVGLPNWTHGFVEEFKKYRGYDPRPYLPVLAGRIVSSAEVSDRFLYDYRKTVADCLAENHYARFAGLARARGLGIHCEAGGPCWTKAPPMDALRNLGRCDVPMGEFWQSHEWKERGQNHVGKQTASAVHIYGRTYAAAEAFTKIGPHYEECPADLKPTADLAFCEGINRFFLHTSTSSPGADGPPGYEYFAGTHFNRQVTWWAQSGAFLRYLARCQFLLSQGRFVADVLFYNGDNAPNFVGVKHADSGLGRGYDYDVCNAEVLLERVAVRDGRLMLPDGLGYRLLVLPDRPAMPVEVVRKVKELVEAGATVVGPPPRQDPGLRNYPHCDTEVKQLAGAVWGEVDGRAITDRRFGQGRVVWGRTPLEVLEADGVAPDFEVANGNGKEFLDFIHRSTGEAEIYFVANRDAGPLARECAFRVTGRQPELWDPVTGQRRAAPAFRQDRGRTTLPLEFGPYGSMFVVFRQPIARGTAGSATRNFPQYSSFHELSGAWTVMFDPKWGGPESAAFDRLVSWTQRSEPGIRHYSGKATYTKTFDLPEAMRGTGQPVALDLGVVKHVAEVRLNGQSLGVLWTPPFRADVSGAVKPTGNTLEIDIVNLWPNRLIGDAGLPPEQQFTRGNVRLAKDHPLIESGLLGPVTLQRVESPIEATVSARSLGCWFWAEAEFGPEGYRPFLDLVGRHAPYRLLTTSLRVPRRELTEAAVHGQIREAAAYAERYGIKLVVDLDVRLARLAFQRAHPDELQEMLRLGHVELPTAGEVTVTIMAEVPGDHYTFAAIPYVPVASRLVRVYAGSRGPAGFDPAMIEDITARCRVVESRTNFIEIAIPAQAEAGGRHAVVAAAFAHLAPDVFAPHLEEFQREIVRQYGDVPLGGACKDEWGFPPCFDGNPARNDFWFSRGYAAAYGERTGGRDLVRDCLLMWRAEPGRERERVAAINHYQQLAWQRNAALENDFYRVVKEVFGPDGLVATHPTWWPNPDLREFKKNGLHWWASRRDLAQTDEVTPFTVRTALAKKWGSAVWVNMFYASSVNEYEQALWSHALGGGRVNYHPLYPTANALGLENTAGLLRGDLMRGERRVRLLQYIQRAPLDCPVAVLFGHTAAMNWAGPVYNDVGLSLTDALWRQGYPADLIPIEECRSGACDEPRGGARVGGPQRVAGARASNGVGHDREPTVLRLTEPRSAHGGGANAMGGEEAIEEAAALRLDPEGWLRYGAQRYSVAVLFHCEFEPETTAAFVAKAAGGSTALWRVGNWTRDFEGRPFEMKWPATVRTAADVAAGAAEIVAFLQGRGIGPQTPATATIGWDGKTAAPPRTGFCRLVDGTAVWVAGTQNVAGDPIEVREPVAGHALEAEATGLLAVRFATAGRLAAFAAGELRRLRGGGVELVLDPPLDLAWWQDETGESRGVIQGGSGAVPPALLALTTNWLQLPALPVLAAH